MIKKIEITNVKGIGNASPNSNYEFDLYPNKPNIFVASNGFGKSSLATAFIKLKPTKIDLDKNDFYKNNENNKPQISLTYVKPDNTNETLIADENSNQLRNSFSWFVINNQIFAKAKKNRIGGTVIASASLETRPIILKKTIPENTNFSYSIIAQKIAFGRNGKILNNLSTIFNNRKFIQKLSKHFSTLSRINGQRIQDRINAFKERVNLQNGNADLLKEWIENNEIEFLSSTNHLSTIVNLITNFDLGFDKIADNYLSALQISAVYNNNPTEFKNASKRKIYELEKSQYTKVFEDFNSSWKTFKPKEKDGKLIVEIPKATHISNGQRDVMCFIALLKKAELNLVKQNCILIFDEIFDYLDDANLIAVQYYVTQLISKFKREGKKIYPIILTHLNPLYFRNFTFSKQKIHFVEKKEAKINIHFKKLLINREDETIKNNVSKYHLHYDPTQINIRPEFEALNLKPTWGNSSVFGDYLNDEYAKYSNNINAYDPFAVCCFVRKKIEKSIYNKIMDPALKQVFLDKHKTPNKLKYAETVGIEIPETFYLLGIIYNDGMHWKNNEVAIAGKLENLTIKKMIIEI